MNSKLLKLK